MPTAKVILDPTLASAAGPYYTLFPLEPTASTSDWIQADSKHLRPKTQTLKEWLSLIADNATSGGNILMVGHGNDRGLHLYVGDTANAVFLEAEILDAIRFNLEGTRTDASAQETLKMKAGPFSELKALVRKVQALALDRVDVRACNTGQKAVPMSQLQVFFNCNTFCAPKLLDSFGEIKYGRINKDPGFWQEWLKKHKNVTIKGVSPDRFALSRDFTGGVNPQALAESKKAITDWADYYLPPSSVFTGDNQLLYHGLTDLKSSLIFAGEAGFRTQLAEAYKGKEPSRKLDATKSPLPSPDQLP